MLDAMAKTVLDSMGLSGVLVIGLSLALWRLALAYIAARDRTEAILKEHEAFTRRTVKDVTNALNASAASIDALQQTILVELGREIQ